MPNSDNQVRISRRHLLKLIAAAGGGLGASLILPGKWVKPVMRTGVLPVHAQTSQVAPPVVNKYNIATSSETTGTATFNPTAVSPANALLLSVTIRPAGASVPGGNGIAMQAHYVAYQPNGPTNENGQGTLTALTTAGVATFAPIDMQFLMLELAATYVRVTYSFVKATDCDTICSRDVEYTFPQIGA